jgi:transposase
MLAVAENIDFKELYQAGFQTIQQLLQSNQELQQNNQQLQAQVMQQQSQLYHLTKLLQGFKSERFVPPAVELQQPTLDLIFEEAAAATRLADVQKKVIYTTTKQSPDEKRIVRVFPAHLRVEETVIDPKEDISNCKKIGEEISDRLDWKPGELFINREIRNKYCCPIPGKPAEVRIIIADKPVHAIERSIAAEGLLAQLIVDKYVDHMPLNRQGDRFKRGGVTLADSSLADLVRQTAELIMPLGSALLKEMLQHDYWHADETGIKVLDRKKKKDTHNGYFWVYQAGNAPLVYYDYQPGRGRGGPDNILEFFHGFLQVDGYGVYDHFDEWEDITVLYCMAHARRYFFDALANDAARAEYALTAIRKLYDIEAYCKEQHLSNVKILEKRQQEAVPILSELGKWMKEQYVEVPPKSTIGTALAYSIKRWEKLSLYTSEGKLAIDNTCVERSVRPVALGRKNFLFCGSHASAKRTALLYSLLMTCKLNDVNPYDWLKDVLIRIAEHPISRIAQLLPHNWKNFNALETEPNTTA